MKIEDVIKDIKEKYKINESDTIGIEYVVILKSDKNEIKMNNVGFAFYHKGKINNSANFNYTFDNINKYSYDNKNKKLIVYNNLGSLEV